VAPETALDGESFPVQQPNLAGVGPIHGVRVLDLTRVLSGPHAGRTLHDLGALVIKVEPPGGDLTRFTNPRINGIATYFAQQNSGKLNISIDLQQPDGAALLLALMEHVDIVLQNFRPDVMTRLGLSYEAVAAVNPRIIYASICGYGSTGPWQHRRAYASVVGAETGFTKAQGDAQTPTRYINDPHSHADVYSGIECVVAVLAALYQREQTGVGQHIEVSMAQTMLYVNEHAHSHLWDKPVENAIRSFQTGDYPVVTLADGTQAVISGHPADNGGFGLFMTAIGRADLISDPRFSTVDLRLQHFGELIEHIKGWAATIADAEALEAALDPFELTVRDIADSDWAVQTNAIIAIPDRSGGEIRIPNSPWKFSAAQTNAAGLPKYRGEDNVAVLTTLLGMSEQAVAELVDRGVLASRVPKSAQ
jgi:CoA:oxalate CoA-transferase